MNGNLTLLQVLIPTTEKSAGVNGRMQKMSGTISYSLQHTQEILVKRVTEKRVRLRRQSVNRRSPSLYRSSVCTMRGSSKCCFVSLECCIFRSETHMSQLIGIRSNNIDTSLRLVQ